jgi:TonB family protein
MKRYLAALKKNIQSHLAYPASAKDQGQVGATVIRFTLTESGEIQPDSLSVQTSSGSALLDASALKAAQAAAPFMPPPRRMNVSIGLSFFREG